MTQKNQLRKIFRQKRLSLTKQEVSDQSKLICQNIIESFLSKFELAQQVVALYQSINNEVDLADLKDYLLKNKAIIALPKIIDEGSPLQFARLNGSSSLKKNANYGILEPESGETVIPDIVCVPLVVFDKSLHRIGMGKGFFDRTIVALRLIKPEIIFVGVAYDFQCFELAIEVDLCDQKLDFIATPTQFLSSLHVQ